MLLKNCAVILLAVVIQAGEEFLKERETQAFDAFLESVEKDEKLISIVQSIQNHRQPFDDLSFSIKDLFSPVVKSVSEKFQGIAGSCKAYSGLQARFNIFKSDPDTNAYIKQEDINYIIKLYTDKFNIQVEDIIKENKFMRESFDFDKFQ